MSTNKRDKLMQTLCHDLTNEDMDRLLLTIKQKLDKGLSVEQIAAQLLTSISQVVILAAPELEDDEILELSEDIGDALIDKIIMYTGGTVEPRADEVPPHDQLN